MNDLAVIHTKKHQWCVVDAHRFQELNRHKWHQTSHPYFARRLRTGTASGKHPVIYIHQQVANNLYPGKSRHTDHANRHWRDNTEQNIRKLTQGQNMLLNRKKRKGAKFSKFKGVTFRVGRTKPWEVKTSKNGKQIWIGPFKTEIEAARAYNDYAAKEYGGLALLNEV